MSVTGVNFSISDLRKLGVEQGTQSWVSWQVLAAAAGTQKWLTGWSGCSQEASLRTWHLNWVFRKSPGAPRWQGTERAFQAKRILYPRCMKDGSVQKPGNHSQGRSKGPGMPDILGFLLPTVNTTAWKAKCRAKAKGWAHLGESPSSLSLHMHGWETLHLHTQAV